MSLVALYPGPATASTANFRAVAVGNDPLPAIRTLDDQDVSVSWTPVAVPHSSASLQVGVSDITGLPTDSEITVKAIENGAEVQRASVRTLPSRLGTQDSELRVFLASCYCRLNPSSRGASDLFADMCNAYGTPHLKIWCGDQVYLDSPATHFMTHWKETPAEYAKSHLAHYVTSWGKDHLRNPLARGANIFTLDDHEYWNNSPYPNVVVPGLFDKTRRDAWTKIAQALMKAFQGIPDYLNAPPIVVPPVSLLVLDTRTHRTPSGKRLEFMTSADLSRLSQWVASLASSGPGILVLGQPIFHGAGDKAFTPGFFDDFSLADYEQFVQMLRILDSTPRDIAILSGDVHFSRAASMTLPSGKSIVEIINSPLALVVGAPRSNTKDAKGFEKIPGAGSIGSARVSTDKFFKSNADSAVAFSITQAGQHVHVKVDLWPSGASPGASTPHNSYEFDLY